MAARANRIKKEVKYICTIYPQYYYSANKLKHSKHLSTKIYYLFLMKGKETETFTNADCKNLCLNFDLAFSIN